MESLSSEQVLDLLTNGKVGHVAVVDDGVPYVAPMSFVVIDQRICFRTGPGRRLDAIRKNPRVCVEIVRAGSEGGWECVVAEGEAHEIEDQRLRENIVSALLQKYQEEIPNPLSHGSRNPIPQPATFVAVDVATVSGRSSGSWLSIMTRPGRL